MTHEIFILQEHRRRARWAGRHWVTLHYFETLDDAQKMAKFYEDRANYEVRIKVKNTERIIYQTGI